MDKQIDIFILFCQCFMYLKYKTANSTFTAYQDFKQKYYV